jgi:hypothetical protein
LERAICRDGATKFYCTVRSDDADESCCAIRRDEAAKFYRTIGCDDFREIDKVIKIADGGRRWTAS